MSVSQRKSLRRKKKKGVKGRISSGKPKRVPAAVRKDRQVDVKSELVRMTDAVRQKFRNLKQESDSMQKYFENSAKPLVVPLKQQLVESVKDIKKEPVDKVQPKVEVGEAGVQTDTVGGVNASTQTEPGLVSAYVQKLSSSAQDKLDNVYGVRPDGKGGMLIGDSKISFSTSHVYVQDKSYKVTSGLMELLFMQVPKTTLLDKDDLQNYKEILLLTNAHRQHYSAEKPVNANRSKKYVNVISIIFKPEKSGSGLTNEYGNVNEVVDRLRILILSKSAGHSAHDGEIEYLTDVLRQNGVIA